MFFRVTMMGGAYPALVNAAQVAHVEPCESGSILHMASGALLAVTAAYADLCELLLGMGPMR